MNQILQGSVWIGAIALDGFFAISGFLVAASLAKRGLIDYVLSHVLRTFPALLFCVVATVFVFGPAFTSLPLRNCCTHPDTCTYLGNPLAVQKMLWYLLGINFPINGSLWTLTIEVRCCLGLALLTFLGFALNKLTGSVQILLEFTVGIRSFASIPFLGGNPRWARPTLYFPLGMCLERFNAVEEHDDDAIVRLVVTRGAISD